MPHVSLLRDGKSHSTSSRRPTHIPTAVRWFLNQNFMPLLDPIPSPVEYADVAALEWEPLLAFLSGFAASPVGRTAILSLNPSTDESWITRQHQLTGEVRLML